MRTTRAKQLIGLGLLTSALFGIVVVVTVLGAVTLRSGSGADPSDAFSQISTIPENLGELVTWENDQELVRQVEPTTRELVEAAWVRAWSRVDDAQRTGDRELVDTWFLGALADHVAGSSQVELPTAVSQLSHALEVTFYSIDGSIMTLNATSNMIRTVQNGPTLPSEDNFEVVMLLSDGNWRILHLTRMN